MRAGAAPRRDRRPAHGLHPLRHVHGAVPLPRRSAASCTAHPLETSGVGWFGRTSCPRPTGGAAGGGRWPSRRSAASGWPLVRPAACDVGGTPAGALATVVAGRGARPARASAALVAEEALDVLHHLLGVRAPDRARPRPSASVVGASSSSSSSPISSRRRDVAGEVLVLVEVAVDLGLVLGRPPRSSGRPGHGVPTSSARPLAEGQRRLRRGDLRGVGGHGRPQRQRVHAELLAGVVQDADDARRALVLAALQVEAVDERLVGGGADEGDRAAVGARRPAARRA